MRKAHGANENVSFEYIADIPVDYKSKVACSLDEDNARLSLAKRFKLYK